jgi:glycosyltransferase involved in cell wall biosynthesis
VIRRRLAHTLDRRFESLHHRVEGLSGDVARLREDVAAVARRLDEQLMPTLRLLAGRDAENRELLADARSDPAYELAYEEPEPLVTVILPTHQRPDFLRSRSLPAVLAQTHGKLEVLVIGDGADPAAEEVVRELHDERVHWAHTSQRYVYPEPHRHWLAASTLTRNEGYRLASGRWLFDFDDDDTLPADAIARLLEVARERRSEAVQGVIRHRLPDGATQDEVPTPPDRLPLKGAVVHSYLRFFGREHVASAFGIPGDWFRGERMVRAGVRIEIVDHVTYEYYPSGAWRRRDDSPR